MQIDKWIYFLQTIFTWSSLEKPKKTSPNQNTLQNFYSVSKDTTHEPSRVATAKSFSPVCMLLVQLALINVFYFMWQLEDMVFHKSLSLSMFLLSLKQVIWKTSVLYFFYLQNYSAMLIPKLRNEPLVYHKALIYLINFFS